jgi:hypothetical protein
LEEKGYVSEYLDNWNFKKIDAGTKLEKPEILFEKLEYTEDLEKMDKKEEENKFKGILVGEINEKSYLQDSDVFLGRIPNYRIGSNLEFTNTEFSYRLPNAVSGWHESEPHGTWSHGPYSTIIVPLEKPINDSLKLQFSIIPFLCEKFPEQKLEFYIDEVYRSEAKFEGTVGTLTEISLQVPEGENRKQLIFSIRTYDPHVPLEVGENWDQRELGFFLTSLKVVNSAIEVSLDEQ